MILQMKQKTKFLKIGPCTIKLAVAKTTTIIIISVS